MMGCVEDFSDAYRHTEAGSLLTREWERKEHLFTLSVVDVGEVE